MRFAVPPALDPAAFAGWDPRASVVLLGGATMGTDWRVQLAAPAGLDLRATEDAIRAMLDRLVAEMSHWDPSSLLSRFGQAPAGSWHALPPDFAAVMRVALEVAEASRGAFDPAAGALTDLWGLGPVPAAAPPGDAALREAVASGGYHRLALDGARLLQPGGARLDLSGVAKGYAVDRLAALLAGHGVHHALVEVGGECAGRGLRPDGDPWWVELETPGGVAPPIRLALCGLGVATSGDYVRGRHTIDPRTGRPVAHALAVSVVHVSAAVADAWATALTVLPPAQASAVSARHGLAVRTLVRDGGAVVEHISPALAAMLA